ncbi:1,2-dihydroxy-3-keto-5-methylthiopentene dioxygenase [Staphylotrichum longicolle]|uniref:acireductone dioxygenase (Fe(2+)-requiring) n=1 Tax=Staphylotrichum longicolle TaxID=669026 RepID=A0AAD4I1S3_9PEZI|nr:1,2-dihydroxy-3-keto-5-methylthiopentene dioxygenase [Staphylotrichum longicolle]
MRAYFYDNLPGDQRLPHIAPSTTDLTPADLSALGVLYFRIPTVAGVDSLAAERGYRNRDEITVSPDKMGAAYEDKVKSFFAEHLHEDEEIRYVRDGRGYFDVRDKGDRWVRIALEKYIQAMRLFKDEPKWTPLNRSEDLDVNPHRKEYVSQFLG